MHLATFRGTCTLLGPQALHELLDAREDLDPRPKGSETLGTVFVGGRGILPLGSLAGVVSRATEAKFIDLL
jgi:hypothetical protein